jgi:hypothetical protein
VLTLSGPAELIDLMERSLFAAGVITQRIDVARQERCRIRNSETVLRLQAEAGFLVLQGDGE